LLIAAHRELEALCLEREVAHFKQNVALKYAEWSIRIVVHAAARGAGRFRRQHTDGDDGSVSSLYIRGMFPS